MTTAAVIRRPPPARRPESAYSDGCARFRLSGVAWDTYVAMRDDPGLAKLRMTYDRGELELMSPSFSHELVVRMIAKLLDAMTTELRLPVRGARQTTFRRNDLLKGLEPDECWYYANQAAIRGKQEIDLTCDPPPDLVLEVDMSNSSVVKEPIYAALGMPELWRYEGSEQRLHIFLLGPGGYAPASRSRALPFLDTAKLVEFALQVHLADDEAVLTNDFLRWVRREIKPKLAAGKKSKKTSKKRK